MIRQEIGPATQEIFPPILILDKIYDEFQNSADFEIKLDPSCGQGWSSYGGIDVLIAQDKFNPYEARYAHMCYTKCLVFVDGNWAWVLAYGGRSWGRCGTDVKGELTLFKVELPSQDEAEIGKEIARKLVEEGKFQRFSIIAENKRGKYYIPQNSEYWQYITDGIYEFNFSSQLARIIDSTKALMGR